MTLLHYSCKAGAHGVGKMTDQDPVSQSVSQSISQSVMSNTVCAGDPAAALRLSAQLISLGADASLRSRWTNMNALHYAAYFDVPELIRVLLKASKPRGAHAQTDPSPAHCGGLYVVISDLLLFLFHSVELHVQRLPLRDGASHRRLQPLPGSGQMSAGARRQPHRPGTNALLTPRERLTAIPQNTGGRSALKWRRSS